MVVPLPSSEWFEDVAGWVADSERRGAEVMADHVRWWAGRGPALPATGGAALMTAVYVTKVAEWVAADPRAEGVEIARRLWEWAASLPGHVVVLPD